LIGAEASLALSHSENHPSKSVDCQKPPRPYLTLLRLSIASASFALVFYLVWIISWVQELLAAAAHVSRLLPELRPSARLSRVPWLPSSANSFDFFDM